MEENKQTSQVDELIAHLDSLVAGGVGHINVTEGEVGETMTVNTRGCLDCESSPVPMACGVPTVFFDDEEQQ